MIDMVNFIAKNGLKQLDDDELEAFAGVEGVGFSSDDDVETFLIVDVKDDKAVIQIFDSLTGDMSAHFEIKTLEVF